MGLLDDLQKEVKNIRAREIQLNAELEAQQEFYQEHLRPVMVRAYGYFAEVVENLNIVAPDVKAIYPLNPLLENGVALKQSQYTFRSDNRESPHQIDIFCKGTLEKPHEFYLSSQKSVLAHVDLLDRYNFPYHRKNRLDRHYEVRGATFILEGPMIVHIRIAASPADRSVHIGLRNVERQPVKRYKFSPDAIGEEFLERLAKVLIRQIPQLVEQKVDDNLRDQLRHQINRDSRQNEDDLALAYAERESAKATEKNTNLVNKTQSAVVERLRKALKVFAKR
jgi:hypothetical protein